MSSRSLGERTALGAGETSGIVGAIGAQFVPSLLPTEVRELTVDPDDRAEVLRAAIFLLNRASIAEISVEVPRLQPLGSAPQVIPKLPPSDGA